ncbi:MAG TPA: acyl-CoA dehydrogenase family protein, partial [bacterium]|nr:acyl-CoA dehydrogenase family protein [bacterium]
MNSTQYSVDRRDIHFVQKEFLQVQRLLKLPDFSAFSESDLDLVVREGATFVEEVLAPLNKIGDEQGCRLDDGRVITPQGFKDAWKRCADAGWLGITAEPEFGGQGLPLSVAVGILEGFYGANPAMYVTTMLTAGAAGLIIAFGSAEQKRTYCENMITGRWG